MALGNRRPITHTGESSKNNQKVGLRLRQDLGTGPTGFMGWVPEDLSRGSESPLMRLQGVSSEESESDLRQPRSDSGSDLPGELDKSVENTLKSHARRTLGKTGEGLTSVSMYTSSLLSGELFPCWTLTQKPEIEVS